MRDCFIRGHDDSFVVKTTDPERASHSIHYDRCVAWNDWGYAFGVSYETRADIRKVRFTRCDAIFARNWPIGVHVADDGTVEDVLFEDMTVDYPGTDINPMIGRALVKIDNRKDIWAKSQGVGHVRDITLRRIDVEGSNVPPITIEGTDAGHVISDIQFDRVTINGKALKDTDDGRLKANDHVSNLTFGPSR